MDRLQEITSAGEFVTIDGEQYELRPLKVLHYAEAERVMLSECPKPMQLLLQYLDRLPSEHQEKLLTLAYKEERQGEWLPRERVLAWLTENAVGKLFAFWCWIKQANPAITLQRAEELRDRLAEQESEAATEADLGLPAHPQ